MRILLHGITRHDLATLCGNEHMKKPRRAITSHHYFVLGDADSGRNSKYSSEERLVANVGLTEGIWRVGR